MQKSGRHQTDPVARSQTPVPRRLSWAFTYSSPANWGRSLQESSFLDKSGGRMPWRLRHNPR